MPTPARKIGAYTLGERIAVGGMAEIWRARRSGEPKAPWVALKRLKEGLAQDPEMLRMFEEEARIGAVLRHPNIVRVLDRPREGEEVLIMELVDGVDLVQVLDKLQGRPLSAEICALIAREAARALAHAHGLADEAGNPLGLVHQDVSPGNVMVSRTGEVKLIDFGVAQLAATPTELAWGKAQYLAPERTRGASTPRSDLFALGVVLYELLVGRRLFKPEEREVQRRLMAADYPRPSRLNPTVPIALEALVMKAMAPRPEDRFPSAAAFAEALDDWLSTRDPLAAQRELGATVKRLFPAEGAEHAPEIRTPRARGWTAALPATLGLLVGLGGALRPGLPAGAEVAAMQPDDGALEMLAAPGPTLEATVKALEGRVAAAPRDPSTLAALATMRARAGKAGAGSLLARAKALGAAPGDVARAEAAMGAGGARAEALARACLDQAPRDAICTLLLLEAQLEAGDLDGATITLPLAPPGEATTLAQGRLEAAQGRWAAAVDTWASGGAPAHRLEAARLYARAERWDEAQALLGQASALPEARALAAQIWITRGDPARARREAEPLEGPETHLAAAEAELAADPAGGAARAAALVRAALALRPGWAEAVIVGCRADPAACPALLDGVDIAPLHGPRGARVLLGLARLEARAPQATRFREDALRYDPLAGSAEDGGPGVGLAAGFAARLLETPPEARRALVEAELAVYPGRPDLLAWSMEFAQAEGDLPAALKAAFALVQDVDSAQAARLLLENGR